VTQRLIRIEWLITSLTLVAATAALASSAVPPLGIALGGTAALFDFTMLRRLGAATLTRHMPVRRLVSMAIAKSLLLLLIPATALLLPRSLVDAVSFAIGVTTLPVAVVLDACLPLVAHGRA
jgi:uncharacterized membrane protein